MALCMVAGGRLLQRLTSSVSSGEIMSAQEHAEALRSLIDGTEDELGTLLAPIADYLERVAGGLRVFGRCECGVMVCTEVPAFVVAVRVFHTCRCGKSFEQDVPQD